ncbi:hypothetical protein LL065_26080 (plasmid) [Clostridium estertheticum]|uniref:hypothetical protein n=1 Tax=Clostridium estertheticum TaxID=238834 RepID=UPI00227A4C17|nr:hypothetical protein [Clostridium estertheticum]WAG44038.1 hypothetical protein LL065_26080 [Clostridium estertheticum]
MSMTPMAIYILIVVLILLILLSIFNKKLKSQTVMISEYILWITSTIGIFLMFFECS